MSGERVLRLNWAGGDCLLSMSTTFDGLEFDAPPLVSLHVHLEIDGFHSTDGHRGPPRCVVCLPVWESPATFFDTVEAAREILYHQHFGYHERRRRFPNVALRRLMEELSRYVSGVAGWLLRRPDRPFLARVHTDARVRMFVGDEEESGADEEDSEDSEENDGVYCNWAGMEMDDGALPPLPIPPEVGRRHSPEQIEDEEEEEEGEICDFCLRRMMAPPLPWYH